MERGTVFRFYLNKRHSFMGLVGGFVFVVVLWDFFVCLAKGLKVISLVKEVHFYVPLRS